MLRKNQIFFFDVTDTHLTHDFVYAILVVVTSEWAGICVCVCDVILSCQEIAFCLRTWFTSYLFRLNIQSISCLQTHAHRFSCPSHLCRCRLSLPVTTDDCCGDLQFIMRSVRTRFWLQAIKVNSNKQQSFLIRAQKILSKAIKRF